MALAWSRRMFLASTAIGLLSSAFSMPTSRTAKAQESLNFGPASAFSFEALINRARLLAQEPYHTPERPSPEIVRQINYEAHGKIKFRPETALYASGPSLYPATFFHLGAYFPKKVAMYALQDGKASEILYASDYFDMPQDSVARGLPPNAGFAGFRLQEARNREDWKTHDWVAFLGAAYFRAIGELNQYGLSARGVTIDTAASKPEEFPDFVEFYIGVARAPGESVTVYALLDGPSITGAYRFDLWRGEAVLMEIEKHLFLRQDVERLGLAPLTSMFWYAEHYRRTTRDWRPEVHDSDGLALWTSGGERIWRPLNNAPATTVSSFVGESPRGFGLLQRDRDFEHYLDGVRYDRRPSIWVEPLDNWGPGSIQLVEIPTDDEIHDNIVAFWVPRAPARAGASFRYRYRLHWRADEPFPETALAYCVATRRGRGGEPGKPRPEGVVKYVVEFTGAPLQQLSADTAVEAVVNASRGELSMVFAEQTPGTRRWRIQFDLTVDGPDPVELRAFLKLEGKPLTETWLYQHHVESSV